MPLLKVGEWILNTEDISAVRRTETREGVRVDVLTRSGGERYRASGGFSAEGEEATRFWAYLMVHSVDVLSTLPPAGDAAVGAANGREGRVYFS